MPITAEAFDGSTHEFPDSTPPEKIRDVIGQYTMQKRMEQNREVPKAIARGFFVDLPGDIFDTLTGKTARELTSYIDRGKPKGEEIFSAPSSEKWAQQLGIEKGKSQGFRSDVGLGALETVANPASWVGPGGPVAKALGAAVSGGASEAAGEAAHAIAPKSENAETLARVGAGFLGGHGTGSVEKFSRIRAGEEKLKTGETLHDKSQQGYAELLSTPASITKQGMVDLHQKINAELASEGFTPTTARRTFKLLHQNFRSGRAMNEIDRVNDINRQVTQIDATIGTLQGQQPTAATARLLTQLRDERDRLEASRANPYANAAMSRKVSDVMDIYSQLGHVRPDVDAADANAAQIARSTLLEWLHDETPEGTAKVAHQATRDWAAHKQIEEIENVRNIGEHRADVSGSGFNMDNTLRQEIRKIADSKKLSRGKSDAWKAQAANIIQGSIVRNTARMLGRTTWINSPITTIAATLLNQPLAVGLFLGTHTARKLGDILTEKEVEHLITIIKEEAPSNKYRAGQNRKLRRDLGHGSSRTGFHPSLPEMSGIRGAETVGEEAQTRDPLKRGKEVADTGPGLEDLGNFARGGLYGVAKGRGYAGTPTLDKAQQVAQDLDQGAIWTGGQFQTAAKLLREGKSYQEIADATGKTYRAVEHFVARNMPELSPRANDVRWDPQRLEDLRELAPHVHPDEAAKFLGFSRKAILNAADRHGISFGGAKPLTAAEHAMVQRLRQQGLSPGAIAKQINRSRNAVKASVDRHQSVQDVLDDPSGTPVK